MGANVWFQKICIPTPWKVIGNSLVIGGGGSQKPKFIKESMKLNWKFVGEGKLQTKKPYGRYWIYSETTQYMPVQSMFVSCPACAVISWHSWKSIFQGALEAHLPVPVSWKSIIKLSPFLQNSNCKYTPCLQKSSSKKPPYLQKIL